MEVFMVLSPLAFLVIPFLVWHYIKQAVTGEKPSSNSSSSEGHAAEQKEDDVDYPYLSKTGDVLRVGDTVMHDHFGRGSIEQIRGAGAGVNVRATVHFNQHGSKILLLDYANLVKVMNG